MKEKGVDANRDGNDNSLMCGSIFSMSLTAVWDGRRVAETQRKKSLRVWTVLELNFAWVGRKRKDGDVRWNRPNKGWNRRWHDNRNNRQNKKEEEETRNPLYMLQVTEGMSFAQRALSILFALEVEGGAVTTTNGPYLQLQSVSTVFIKSDTEHTPKWCHTLFYGTLFFITMHFHFPHTN